MLDLDDSMRYKGLWIIIGMGYEGGDCRVLVGDQDSWWIPGEIGNFSVTNFNYIYLKRKLPKKEAT